MPIIPFNPGSAGGTECAAGSPAAESTQCEHAPRNGTTDAAPECDRRIDRLEHALIAALRENARNWARAERAEQLLERGAAAETTTAGREEHWAGPRE